MTISMLKLVTIKKYKRRGKRRGALESFRGRKQRSLSHQKVHQRIETFQSGIRCICSCGVACERGYIYRLYSYIPLLYSIIYCTTQKKIDYLLNKIHQKITPINLTANKLCTLYIKKITIFSNFVNR